MSHSQSRSIACLVGLLVAACATAASSPSGGPAIESPPASQTVQPTAGRESPYMTVPPNPIAWTFAGVLPVGGGASEVMPSEPGFLAVGVNADLEPAAWRSADGRTWRYIALPGEGQPLAADTSGLMALIVGCSGCGGEGDIPEAVSWTSSNGNVWKRHTVGVQHTAFSSVRYVDSRLVAVGLTDYFGFGEGAVGCGEPVSWTSTDGVAWSASRKLGASDCGRVEDLTLADGRLVAIGTDGIRTGATAAVTWISNDGRSWERSNQVLAGADWTALTAGGPGLIAVGTSCHDQQCGAMVWTSAEGRTWTAVPDQKVFGEARMRDVLVVDDLVIAAGDTDDFRPVVWTSRDLRSWVRADMPGDVTDDPITGVAVTDSLLVAVGLYGHIWLGEPRR